MDHDQLAAAHTAVIRRHWRTLNDNGGQPPGQLLADLAVIADKHADQATREAAAQALNAPPATLPDGHPLAAPRRASTRRTAK